MNILMCIGNNDRGDDGVGNYIASEFSHPDWRVLDCQTVPESFSGVVTREKPDKLVLVDAADMKLAPGEIRRIRPDNIREVNTGTHSMPLYLLINHLAEYTRDVTFVGIQPESAEYEAGISPKVMRAAELVVELIKKNRLDRIELLESH